jgi:hypothetical protein
MSIELSRSSARSLSDCKSTINVRTSSLAKNLSIPSTIGPTKRQDPRWNSPLWSSKASRRPPQSYQLVLVHGHLQVEQYSFLKKTTAKEILRQYQTVVKSARFFTLLAGVGGSTLTRMTYLGLLGDAMAFLGSFLGNGFSLIFGVFHVKGSVINSWIPPSAPLVPTTASPTCK